jgi:flagellar hook-associated protein 3 FlgL
MTSSVSALGLQLFTTSSLQAEQTNLAQLNEELASNQQHDDLTDYSPLDAQQLLNFQDAIVQRQSYIAAMQSVSPRLNIYNTTMSDMTSIASQAQELASQNPSLNPNTTGTINTQVQSYMQQVVSDLNQQVNGRFIYAGTRFTTEPVSLNAVLSNLTPSATTAEQADPSPNNLPSYDTDFGTADPNVVAAAWTNDSAAIDTGDNLTYGVTSTQDGFQQLIAGLQFVNAATQPGTDAATYQSDMSQASTLLNTAVTNIQVYQAGTAAAINTVSSEQTAQNNDITGLQQQIGNIQNVDLTQVGTELNLLQTQLQASYSATATLTQDSILRFL